MRVIKDKTQSLCNVCYEQIPATVFEEQGQVFIRKFCPQHGEFKGLVEKDANFYTSFAHINPNEFTDFYTFLVIPITYNCNLECKYCFAPFIDRMDISLSEIKRIVNGFSGKFICLSGGEPTLREDLESIIAVIKQAGKHANLLTNGLKLSDLKYLRRLKNAGLDSVTFSLDSFKEDFYSKMKTGKGGVKNILNSKKIALSNLEKEKIPTFLSATIYPGLNDEELKDLFIFSLKKNHFIEQLRVRSCIAIGRHIDYNKSGYFTSELLQLFSEQINIDKKILIDNFLADDYHTPNHIFFRFEGYLKGKDFIPIFNIKFKNLISKLLTSFFYHSSFMKIVKRILYRLSIKKLYVRIVSWPTVENIDIQEVDRGLGYLCEDNKILHFCHALVLENR